MRQHGPAFAVTICLAACALPACGSADSTVEQETKAFHSAQATTGSVVEAWLGSRASTAYARVTLERAFELAEKSRTSLTASPELAANSRAAALADRCAHLSRSIAALIRAVDAADRGEVERLAREAADRAPS